jgi:hypothetical protein
MRITPDLLLKLANDYIAQCSKTERGILAVYLQGSLLRDNLTIGGTTDIDLFFLHTDISQEEREFVRITDEIHMDISHHPVSLYRRPKELRSHTWLGPGIEGCKILYDPQHFLDFTQASVRGQFRRSDQVLRRVRPQAEHARQIWLALTERRFLIDFPERAGAVKHAGLYAGLLGLLGAPLVDAPKVRAWLPDWQAAYEAAAQNQVLQRIHPVRLNYYLKAFESLLDSERFQVVLWPLWRTWTQIVDTLPEQDEYLPAWQKAGESLGMLADGFQERISALDAFLDLVDETIENWARENGA